MLKSFSFFLFVVYVSLFSTNLLAQRYIIKDPFNKNAVPPVPDYTLLSMWAAHPEKEDMADKIPKGSPFKDQQKEAKADVFFIYPTIYGDKPTNEYTWNASVNDDVLNEKIDGSTILNQASVFNGSCRVFVPRYRQAHYSVFLTTDTSANRQALELAYQDVKAAFVHYLEKENNGRPIVIASHSQGTIHARRLLKDFFDGTPRQKQLVAAYLVGIAVQPDTFQSISPSKTPGDVGGFVSWNTFLTGYYPTYYKNGLHSSYCVNPLTWTDTKEFISEKQNVGGVGLGFKWVENPADAQVHEGLLWIHQPYIKGRIFLRTKVWHYADINLYWGNIRENVALRLENFLSQSIKE